MRAKIEKQAEERLQESSEIRSNRLQEEIAALKEKIVKLRESLAEVQHKLKMTDGETYVAFIREKIVAFFSMKLGRDK